jgi:hypothetical protein
MSWESVLFNRWPNLKAVIAQASTVSEDTICPVHQVWISPRNAVNFKTPPQDNPLHRISRLIYGRAFSDKAIHQTGLEEEAQPSFKSNFAIQEDAPRVKSSLISGPGSEDSPFSSRPEATMLMDDRLHGFDFYVRSDAPELDNSLTYGQMRHIAFLFCLSRDASPATKWSMEIACADPMHLFYWLAVVSLSPMTRIQRSDA